MRILTLCLSLASAALLTSCDDDGNPTFIFQESARLDLVGVWAGVEDITTVEGVGSSVSAGPSRGYSFPVTLTLRADGTFRLFTGNLPASYFSEEDRICEGVFTRQNSSVQFFPAQACRALPFTTYAVGRVLPFGLTLQASTVNTGQYSAASIKVQLRLDRD
jgi:hypothetical protein